MGACSARNVKIHVDKSRLDHNVSKGMIPIVLDEITNLIVDRAPHSVQYDMLVVMAGIYRILISEKGYVHLRMNDGSVSKVLIEKGVVPGWRWTALIDTIANIGIATAVSECVRRVGRRLTVFDYLTAQSDDHRTRVSDPWLGIAVVIAYKLLNFVVNPAKFFVSRVRDEYLRLVYTEKGVTGYLARTTPTLLVRNPLRNDPMLAENSLRATLSLWVKASCSYATTSLATHMVRSLSGSSGQSNEEIIRWLGTPASLGGGGLLPWTVNMRGVKPGRKIFTRDLPVINVSPASAAMPAAYQEAGTPTRESGLDANDILPMINWNRSMYEVEPDKLRDIRLVSSP